MIMKNKLPQYQTLHESNDVEKKFTQQLLEYWCGAKVIIRKTKYRDHVFLSFCWLIIDQFYPQ